MAIQALNPSSIIAATGWTNATVASLEAVDANRATGGVAGTNIHAELDNAPADYGGLTTVQLHVNANTVGTVSRTKAVTVELLDGSNTVLETFGPQNITGTATTYNSTAFSRSATQADVDAWRIRVSITEGGGMSDSATVSVDRLWATIDYTVAVASDDLTASGITTGAPSVGTSTLGQIHSLTATGVATGAPSVGSGTLGQTHDLTASSVTTGDPTLGSPSIGEAGATHDLTATAIITAAPSLGTPTIAQIVALSADSIVVGSPVLGIPAIGQTHDMAALSIVTAAPTLGSPADEEPEPVKANGRCKVVKDSAKTVAYPAARLATQ